MVFKYTPIILRLIFAVLFSISAFTKLADIQSFAQSMNSYEILPRGLVPLFAYYVPILELILAVGFILPGFTKINAVLTAFVVVVFQFALVSLLIRGIEIDCGCFGRFATTPKAALLRNFAILFFDGLLLYVLLRSDKLQNSNNCQLKD